MADQPPVLSLDQDVVDWLHQHAVERFGGDFERCINVVLRAAMIVHTSPDHWAAVNYEAGTKGPGRRFDRSRSQDSTG